MDHEIAVIKALLDLVEGPAHFIGHSFGGSVLVRAAVRMPLRVRSLTLVEPTLFYLLGAFGKCDEDAEIRAVADRVIRLVDAGDPDEGAREFINYWVGPGGFDTMAGDLRATVARGMVKLRHEWAAAFKPCGATIEKLADLKFPIQLIVGAKTTAAASSVMGILRQIWPAARYAEIDDAGHMSPVSHAGEVNRIIEKFVGCEVNG